MKQPVATKIDLYAEHKSEYVAKRTPLLVETAKALYLAIEGTGDPNGEAFSEAIGALYGIAFTIKMRRKFAGLGDYTIAKLEALWPQGDGGPLPADRTQWQWRLMIRTPEFITKDELKQAVVLQLERGKSEKVREVKLFPLNEGLCVQILHVGPYDCECESITKMLELATAKGCKLAGAHHEIYLNDPQRMAPEKLRTILRHPLKKC